MPRSRLADIAACLTPLHFPRNHVCFLSHFPVSFIPNVLATLWMQAIARQGEDANLAFIVASGQVSLHFDSEAISLDLSVIGQNDMFGDGELLLQEKRFCSYICRSKDCVVWAVSRHTLSLSLSTLPPLFSSRIGSHLF